MADELPPVKIQLVAGGVQDVKTALKTVETAIRQHYLNTAKFAVQSARKQQREYDNLYKNIDRQADNHDSKAIQQQKSLNDKLISQEKALTAKLIAEYKTRGSAFKDSLGRLGRSGVSAGSGVRVGGGAGRNNMAAAAGAIFGIGGGGGILGRGVQGASAGYAIGGVGGAGIGAAAAIGAASVQKAFEVLISGIKYGVETFYSAVTQLGGGFNVADSIAQRIKNKRAAAETAASTAFLKPEERLTSTQAMAYARGVTRGTEFSTAEGLAAQNAWIAKTGDKKGFAENGSFLTRLATGFMGGDLTGATNQMANTKAQFSGLSSKDLQRLTMGEIQLAQRGSIEFKDTQSTSRITGAAGQQTGDMVKNITRQIGLAQIIAPGAGGNDEAITQVHSLNMGLSRLARAKTGSKDWKEAQTLGIKTDANGKITNYEDTVKKLALMNPKSLPKAIADESRAASAIQNIKNKITGDTSEEQSKSLDKLMKDFTDISVSTENFKDATQELVDGPIAQLKAFFNELSEQTGKKLELQFLKLVDALTSMDLDKITDTLSESFEALQTIIEASLPFLALFSQAVAGFAMMYAQITGNTKMYTEVGELMVKLGGIVEDLNKTPEERKEDKRRRQEIVTTADVKYFAPGVQRYKDLAEQGLIDEYGGGKMLKAALSDKKLTDEEKAQYKERIGYSVLPKEKQDDVDKELNLLSQSDLSIKKTIEDMEKTRGTLDKTNTGLFDLVTVLKNKEPSTSPPNGG